MAEHEAGHWVEEALHIREAHEWGMMVVGIFVPPSLILHFEESFWTALRQTAPLTIAVIVIINVVFLRDGKSLIARICWTAVILSAAALIAVAFGEKSPNVWAVGREAVVAAKANPILTVIYVPVGLLTDWYHIYHPQAFWISIAAGTILGAYLASKGPSSRI
jgi:hypothetical protein